MRIWMKSVHVLWVEHQPHFISHACILIKKEDQKNKFSSGDTEKTQTVHMSAS